MNLLIAAATDKELEAVKRYFNGYNSNTVILTVTGVGSIATCFALTEAISTQSPDMVIQIGIGGSFSDELAIGSAVVVKSEVIADMGVIETDGYKNIFELGLTSGNTFPYKEEALINGNSELIQMTGMKAVVGITANEITTQPEKISLFKDRYGAEIESMEGAALHYVCISKKIPFIQIRGISNLIGERNKSKWKINEAIDSSSNACIALVDKLTTTV